MMCGILCLYNQQRNVLDDCGKFNKMLHLLDHRGPDDMRTYFDQHVLLGHCRLSIIDLKGGMQPLEYTYQDITYRIIFNGEIYRNALIYQSFLNTYIQHKLTVSCFQDFIY